MITSQFFTSEADSALVAYGNELQRVNRKGHAGRYVMKDSHIAAGRSGRRLAYSDIGEAGWPCCFFFHGAPMSRLHLAYLEREFLARQIRVISPDRPSYGGSSPHPGRSMADWPVEVAELADALHVERFAVAGHSSGGPYAVACAVLLPDRVFAAVVSGGVTDMAWAGAWDGYPASEIEIMRLPDEEAAVDWCTNRYGADGLGFLEASGFEFGEPDAALLGDAGAGPAISAALAEAFRQGVTGYAQDVFVQGRPWPFDPRAIVAPVHVLHGELDRLLPPAHSRHTADLIPGSSLRVLPGHGHLTMLSELPDLLSGLARVVGRADSPTW